MTKRYSRAAAGLFCLFLGGMLVWSLLLPDRARSETENRTLAQWPSFSAGSLLDGSFTQGVEDYMADQFPLRDQWTGLKTRAELLLGKQECGGVFLCGDTLIARVEPPENGRDSKNLALAARLAAHTDARVTLGLIPSAAEIWKDRLPAGAESWEQTALLAAAESTGLPTVDFESALAAHASEPVFYRTDHHWTTLGAFYGANAVLEALGKAPLQAEDFTPQTVSETFNGTLYSQSGIHFLTPDTMEFWVEDTGLRVTSWRNGTAEEASLYDSSYLSAKDQYSAFLGGNQPLCVIENEAVTDGSRLLLVRDSYSDALAPFLAQRFSQVHLIDLRYYRLPVSEYAAEQDIGDILVVYSVPNFISDRDFAALR